MELYETRKEWLEARRWLIGGSDASSVVGMNPYKTNVELWMEKTGCAEAEDISGKPYVKYGTEAEEHLRRLFALDFPEMEVSYEPNNLWKDARYPWAHASLDGWLKDRSGRFGILEIKTTNILQSMQREKWKDQIPDNYYVQVLHCMAVTDAEFAILKAQLKSGFGDGLPYIQTKHYLIEREDAEDDIRYLMEEERRFAECVRKGRKPALKLEI